MKKKEEEKNLYIVQDGDCYSKIARILGITLEELLEKNKIKDDSKILIGQKLVY